MIPSLIRFLNVLSNKIVVRISGICVFLFYNLIFNNKFHLNNGTTILLCIPLTWLSVTLPLLSGVAKIVSSEEEMKKRIARFAITLGIITIIISLIGPIILYFLWLQADAESFRLRQLI